MKVNGGGDPERNDRNGHEEDERKGSEDRGENAPLGHSRFRVSDDKIPTEAIPSMPDDISEDDHHHQDNDQAGEPGHPGEEFSD